MKRILLFLLALLSSTLFAAEDDEQQVRSLAERGQFSAVEALCREKFEQPDFTGINKIRLVAELVRSRSMQLLVAEPAERTRIVQQLKTLETEWLTLPADSAAPDLALAQITLRQQLAMAHWSLGDYQRLEAETASETNKQIAYRQARSTLQDSIERLKKCRQELQAFRQRIGINADSSLQQNMQALEYSIAMQQGIALKSSALTLQTKAERNFELRQAAETLSELASKHSTEPVFVQCKIEKAACHRLCGELDQCAEILSPLLNTLASLTPECRLQAEAEWIRYQIAEGNVAAMRRHYAADRADARFYPDFDLARLELFMANDPAKNIRPEVSSAMRLQQAMARQLGSYWGRRAAMTVSLLSSGNTELISADILKTLADNAYRDNKFAESAGYYEQAAAKADANRQADNMFLYNRLAAAAWAKALEQAPEESKAEYRNRLIPLLRKLAVQNPNHPEALNGHLSAIDLQVQIVLSQPETLDDYLMLVREHTEHWSDSPQLQRLRRLSVILLERQGRIDEASAILPFLDLEQLEKLPPGIQRLRVRQLDSEGKTQEAVDILKVLLKQKREPATLQLFAEILARQSDEASLNDALNFWTELEQGVPKNGEMWWSAREGIMDVFCKLSRYDDARKSFDMLRVLYPDLGGADRKERLTKRFAKP